MALNHENIDRRALSELMGDRIHARGLTLTQLSFDLQLSRPTVAAILRGARLPASPLLEQILAYLEISIDEVPQLAQAPSTPAGKHIFISYSHRDIEYLDRLMVHLKPLQRQGLIDTWVDTRIAAGDKWKKEIEKALKTARVAILLVSADFLASDFIVENELPPLLQTAEEKGTLIIPIVLKPCRYTRDKNLRDFQAINSPEEPLSLINENERELVYDSVAQRVEELLAK